MQGCACAAGAGNHSGSLRGMAWDETTGGWPGQGPRQAQQPGQQRLAFSLLDFAREHQGGVLTAEQLQQLQQPRGNASGEPAANMAQGAFWQLPAAVSQGGLKQPSGPQGSLSRGGSHHARHYPHHHHPASPSGLRALGRLFVLNAGPHPVLRITLQVSAAGCMCAPLIGVA
jgi:hypothetical protein